MINILQSNDFRNMQPNKQVVFGILCAKAVYQEESFIEWAEKWLSDEDRSKESAMNITDMTFAAYQNAFASADDGKSVSESATAFAAYTIAKFINNHYPENMFNIMDVNNDIVTCVAASMYASETSCLSIDFTSLMKKAMEVK